MLDPLSIKNFSVKRIHPASEATVPESVPLSIIDSTTTYYSPSGLVIFYDATNARPLTADIPSLVKSLETTLSAYPYFAGQLQWTPYEPSRGHSYRYQRLQVTWGSLEDPGVEFVVAESPKRLDKLVPAMKDRHMQGSWDSSVVPTTSFFTSGPLALSDMKTYRGLPAASAQVTSFGDGGLAVAFRIAHPLADAHSLRLFMQDWASVHRSMLKGSPPPLIGASFEPSILDSKAAGDIDAPSPSREVVERARTLPIHRYDQWRSRAEAGFYSAVQDAPRFRPGPEFDKLSPSTRIPWEEWDVRKPCSPRILHFTAKEVQSIHAAATGGGSGVITRHNSLVAHLWRCIARARNLHHDTEDVFVDMSLGLRKRVSPALADDFMGSPIIMAHCRMSGQQVCRTNSIGEIAHRISEAWKKVSSETVPSLLHDLAYEACPTRLWQGFLGRRHVMLTSWIHERLYNIMFSDSSSPLLVRPLLIACDGLMSFIEPCELKEKEKWHEHGIDVELYLDAEAMTQLLQDTSLRIAKDP